MPILRATAWEAVFSGAISEIRRSKPSCDRAWSRIAVAASVAYPWPHHSDPSR